MSPDHKNAGEPKIDDSSISGHSDEPVSQFQPKLPLAGGYIVVDQKKCAGCIACMVACSLVHQGECTPSLSRIQVLQNPFGCFPNDIEIKTCRQCANPQCVRVCPTGALHVDTANYNIRTVDTTLCDGCQQCVNACPFTPIRIIWDEQRNIPLMCDLCVDTHGWIEEGGVMGKQACVEACPMRAIALVTKAPDQRGEEGYYVNLRNEHWGWLGYPTD